MSQRTCEFRSDSGQWVPALVLASDANAGLVRLDVAPGLWMKQNSSRIRYPMQAMPAHGKAELAQSSSAATLPGALRPSGAPPDTLVVTQATSLCEYRAASGWVCAHITKYDADTESVQVDAEPGAWVKLTSSRLRPRAGVSNPLLDLQAGKESSGSPLVEAFMTTAATQWRGGLSVASTAPGTAATDTPGRGGVSVVSTAGCSVYAEPSGDSHLRVQPAVTVTRGRAAGQEVLEATRCTGAPATRGQGLVLRTEPDLGPSRTSPSAMTMQQASVVWRSGAPATASTAKPAPHPRSNVTQTGGVCVSAPSGGYGPSVMVLAAPDVGSATAAHDIGTPATASRGVSVATSAAVEGPRISQPTSTSGPSVLLLAAPSAPSVPSTTLQGASVTAQAAPQSVHAQPTRCQSMPKKDDALTAAQSLPRRAPQSPKVLVQPPSGMEQGRGQSVVTHARSPTPAARVATRAEAQSTQPMCQSSGASVSTHAAAQSRTADTSTPLSVSLLRVEAPEHLKSPLQSPPASAGARGLSVATQGASIATHAADSAPGGMADRSQTPLVRQPSGYFGHAQQQVPKGASLAIPSDLSWPAAHLPEPPYPPLPEQHSQLPDPPYPPLPASEQRHRQAHPHTEPSEVGRPAIQRSHSVPNYARPQNTQGPPPVIRSVEAAGAAMPTPPPAFKAAAPAPEIARSPTHRSPQVPQGAQLRVLSQPAGDGRKDARAPHAPPCITPPPPPSMPPPAMPPPQMPPQVPDVARPPPLATAPALPMSGIAPPPAVQIMGPSGIHVSDSLQMYMTVGDVLFTNNPGPYLQGIGAAGGALGHVAVVTGIPRAVPRHSAEGIQLQMAVPWPAGNVQEMWKVPTMESTHGEAGLFRSETLLYVDQATRQMIMVGDVTHQHGRPQIGVGFEYITVQLWQSPPILRNYMNPMLATQVVQEMAASTSDWSWVSGIRAMFMNPVLEMASDIIAEVKEYWHKAPICTSVVIVFWQRYLCKAAEVGGHPWTAADMIRNFMPLKADRTLPTDLLATMSRSGWVPRTTIHAQAVEIKGTRI
mmetsp:Transcript_45764/g.106264  ORF Transcript_45764/g.106264 Transcript_45764/m.106264 type:complete len:1046 (+) Transcript_45764:60-3197(+)